MKDTNWIDLKTTDGDNFPGTSIFEKDDVKHPNKSPFDFTDFGSRACRIIFNRKGSVYLIVNEETGRVQYEGYFDEDLFTELNTYYQPG